MNNIRNPLATNAFDSMFVHVAISGKEGVINAIPHIKAPQITITKGGRIFVSSQAMGFNHQMFVSPR